MVDFPTPAGIDAAYAAIDPVFRDTALIEHGAANDALGLRLLAKVESLNPTRAFKGRGTDWFLHNLPPDVGTLVAASAGNFGQGLAYAYRKRGRKLVMFAATTANPLKVEAMRALGAEVRLTGEDFDAAKAVARRFAADSGFRYVEDGAERTIAEGAGTIALELTRQLSDRATTIDAILVPLGNGALLTGIGTWIKHRLPTCRIIGVVATQAPSMLESWQSGELVTTASAATIADGIAVREPVPYALASMKTTVDEVWAVSEESLIEAMTFCHRHYGLVIEPAGAAGVAAVLQPQSPLAGRCVATVLCGGNLTPDQMKLYLG